jgi:hypoxanthine phosphoribosyltransferase
VLKHRVLFGETAIAARVQQLAEAVRRDLPDSAPIIIGLLTGSFVFLADLVRAAARHGVEPLIDFIATSHYGTATESPGAARILKDTGLDVHGRAVLLVDDILDSGRTLRLVRDHIDARGPLWLRTCVFLDKPARRVVEIRADYVGFEVPDEWIIGYGLDAGGQGRALPYVAAVEPGDNLPLAPSLARRGLGGG